MTPLVVLLHLSKNLDRIDEWLLVDLRVMGRAKQDSIRSAGVALVVLERNATPRSLTARSNDVRCLADVHRLASSFSRLHENRTTARKGALVSGVRVQQVPLGIEKIRSATRSRHGDLQSLMMRYQRHPRRPAQISAASAQIGNTCSIRVEVSQLNLVSVPAYLVVLRLDRRCAERGCRRGLYP